MKSDIVIGAIYVLQEEINNIPKNMFPSMVLVETILTNNTVSVLDLDKNIREFISISHFNAFYTMDIVETFKYLEKNA